MPVPTTGSWELFARWTSHSNRASDAPFTVYHAGGSTTVPKNQRLNGGEWVSLGVYSFNAGAGSVVLSDDANGVVVADAIKIVPSVVEEVVVDDVDSAAENGPAMDVESQLHREYSGVFS